MNRANYCDLRSDTVTHPTAEMYRAMHEAELGDDVLGDDPTIKRLEQLAAEVTGKEAALFFPSGTMANTAALLTYNCRLQEVIVEEQSHILNYENGNISTLAGAVVRALPSEKGAIPLSELNKNLKTIADDHQLKTAGICLENTHNYYSGAVLHLSYLQTVYSFCRQNNIFLHIDGARVFNASIALNIELAEIAACGTSLMFCLSKGLSAPIGSILVGDQDFINRAYKFRKILGGGMRQAGLLAACGIVALKTMPEKLTDDHRRARILVEGIAEMKHLTLEVPTPLTNIVIFRVNEEVISAEELQRRLFVQNVHCFTFGKGRLRFVTHKDQSDEQIHYALKTLQAIVNSL